MRAIPRKLELERGDDADGGDALVIDGGLVAKVRPIRPDDSRLLRDGFARLSPDARYNRFFIHKSALLDAELRYLTEVDQRNHVAFIMTAGEDGDEQAVAVARAVRLPSERGVYEAAVTVLDAHQRHGLGTFLVARLMRAAAERRAHTLRFFVLPTNSTMMRLLRRVTPECRVAGCDGEDLVCIDVALSASAPAIAGTG